MEHSRWALTPRGRGGRGAPSDATTLGGTSICRWGAVDGSRCDSARTPKGNGTRVRPCSVMVRSQTSCTLQVPPAVRCWLQLLLDVHCTRLLHPSAACLLAGDAGLLLRTPSAAGGAGGLADGLPDLPGLGLSPDLAFDFDDDSDDHLLL